MPYTVKHIDLTDAFDEREIAPPQSQLDEIFMLDIPPGASFLLRIGRNAGSLTITRPFSFEPRGEQESNEGLYMTNVTAQPDVIVEIVTVNGGRVNPVI